MPKYSALWGLGFLKPLNFGGITPYILFQQGNESKSSCAGRGEGLFSLGCPRWSPFAFLSLYIKYYRYNVINDINTPYTYCLHKTWVQDTPPSNWFIETHLFINIFYYRPWQFSQQTYLLWLIVGINKRINDFICLHFLTIHFLCSYQILWYDWGYMCCNLIFTNITKAMVWCLIISLSHNKT